MEFAAFDGSRLRAARKQKGLSQSKLAARIGAHVTSVSDWERGDNAPSGRHIASLSRELGVTAEELYGCGDDDEEESSVDDLLSALAEALGPFLRKRAVA